MRSQAVASRVKARMAKPRLATERMTLGIAGVRELRKVEGVRFCALDGTIRVVIEADSEDDARYLCREMRFEFIGLCD